MPDLSLPQPPLTIGQTNRGIRSYKYFTYDVLETDWLGDPRQLQSLMKNSGKNAYDNKNVLDSNARYAPGTLVWVLLSKGKSKQPINNNQSGYNALAFHKKRRDKKNSRLSNSKNTSRNNIGNRGNGDSDCSEKETAGGDTNIQSNDNGRRNIGTNAITTMNQSRKEFFRRARVISDEETTPEGGDDKKSLRKRIERRILVRYSKGATYRVRAYNLIPILEPSIHDNDLLPSSMSQNNEEAQQSRSISFPPMVIVVPETNIYRRVAKVHTTPDDSFMEIGCDYGINVDKIRRSLEEAGDVPKVWPMVDNCGHGLGGQKVDNRVSCLGVDKSKESIDIANERYPKCKFSLGNVLLSEEMSSIRTLCEQSLLGSAPSVICIDVNGNREISGVLECLKMVMNETWKQQPRMIIVKSRFLYWELKKNMMKFDQC